MSERDDCPCGIHRSRRTYHTPTSWEVEVEEEQWGILSRAADDPGATPTWYVVTYDTYGEAVAQIKWLHTQYDNMAYKATRYVR